MREIELPLLIRELEIRKEDVNAEDRTVRMSYSSTTPVRRPFGYETLDHSPGAMSTTRLDAGVVPLLLDHDRTKQIGVVTSHEVKGKRAYATVKFSQSALGDEILKDVQDGIRKSSSVGYIPRKVREMDPNDPMDPMEGPDDADADKDTKRYLITKWEPHEISIVAIPADPTVGPGRAVDTELTYRAEIIGDVEVTQTETVFQAKENRTSMPEQTDSTTQTPPKVEVTREVDLSEVRNSEMARIRELTAIAVKYNAPKELDEWVRSGKTVNDFKVYILENKMNKPPVTSNAGLTDDFMNNREANRYSLCKAILQGAQQLDGLEREVSTEIGKRLGRQPMGFFIPEVALTRDLHTRNLMADVSGSGGVTIQTTVEPTLIEFLRNKIVVARAGATTLGGLVGNVAIVRQTGAAVAQWAAEGASSDPETDQSFDSIVLTPKRLVASSAYSKTLLVQSSLDVEGIVRDDILLQIAIAQDEAAFTGTGATNNQPTGIITIAANTNTTYNPALRAPSVSFGSGAPTWAALVAFEGNVENQNVMLMPENSSYITTPLAKSVLKTTPKAPNYPVFLWGDDNTMNGYPSFATKQVPSNLIVFGKWDECILASWAGIDIVTDPFTLANAFSIKVTMNMLADVNFRHSNAFSVSVNGAA